MVSDSAFAYPNTHVGHMVKNIDSDTKMGNPALPNQCLLQRPSLNVQGSHFDILSCFTFDVTKWSMLIMI